MSGDGFPLPVELDPTLVEEAVHLALRARPRAGYWRAREMAYALGREEEREAAFRRISLGEFEALDLGEPLRRALEEEPLLREEVARCRVFRAASRKEEVAELFVRLDSTPGSRASRTLLLRLRPASFSEPQELLALLRHEISHVRDMVDPAFGYDPSLPAIEGGPMRIKLALQRYRVLWDTVIDGRLWRRGRASPRAREVRQAEFGEAFGMLGEDAGGEFERWFGAAAPTHRVVLEYALAPSPPRPGAIPAAAICPLCRCPAWGAAGWADPLPPPLLEEVRKDFPSWRDEEGLCRQCADLYRGRSLSRAAFALLPGSTAQV
jgi:hypothetical protein